MNVHVFTSVSVKVGGERTWLFARSAIFEVCRFPRCSNIDQKRDRKKSRWKHRCLCCCLQFSRRRPVFSFQFTLVMMTRVCIDGHALQPAPVPPPWIRFAQKMLPGVARSPLFAQQPSRRSWLSRGWLICVDGGVDEHGGSRTLPCVRASTKFWRAWFQRAVCVCRRWDGQVWRISLTCYFLSG